MLKHKWLISFDLLIIASFLICGAAFKSPEVVLDPGKHIVYQGIKADNLIIGYKGNTKSAKEQYEDKYYAVYGKVGDISNNQKEISLIGTVIGDNGKIICDTSSEDIKTTVNSYIIGDNVKVYGRIDSSFFTNQVRIKVDKIEKVNNTNVRSSEYSLINDISVDTEYLIKKELHKGKIKYYVPPEWVKVESNILDTKIGTIDGYQYRLNELSRTVYPESFFVCYFDNGLLASPNDKENTELIEKAIIGNILNQDPVKLKEKFPLKKIESYYGAQYTYYQDKYDSDNDGYHVEFVFQQDGKEGFVVYVYVYKNPDHIDNVMLTMRLLNMN